MTKMEAIRHDRIRKLILESLAKDYPQPLDTVVLRRHMATFGFPLTHTDLNSYIAYLQEKELIKKDERPGGIVLVRATVKGLDALDGRIDVAGIGQDLD